jgi:choloylglycine hydrolase
MVRRWISLRTVAIAAAFVLVLALAGSALACTGIKLTAKDGSVIVARTLEFGLDLQSKILVVPAGTPMSGTLPNNSKGVSYTTKYGFVGANAFGLPVVVDGLNDHGLYVGLFFFPTSATFTPFTPADASRGMGGYEYGAWLLGNFSTVAEVKAAYDHVVLLATPVAQMGGAPPVHFRVVDKTGAAVVIEPINGKLVIYDDPLGVLTNSPAFDWHMTNLNNYIGLSPMGKPSITTGGVTLASFGQGSGFFGMPGDFTPASRFVRAVAFQQSAAPTATGADAVQQAFHLLNNFDIPVGAVRDKVNGQVIDEYTLWTSVNDLNNEMFYFRSFTDQTMRGLDVKKALAASGGKIQQLPLETTQPTPIVPVRS